MEIPDFLKPLPPGYKKPRLATLVEEYVKMFGYDCSTENCYLSNEEMEAVFEQCIKEKRTFNDVMGFDDESLDPDDDL